jgi:hypothetical protein
MLKRFLYRGSWPSIAIAGSHAQNRPYHIKIIERKSAEEMPRLV